MVSILQMVLKVRLRNLSLSIFVCTVIGEKWAMLFVVFNKLNFGKKVAAVDFVPATYQKLINLVEHKLVNG
jgi:hypothetical protein